jgi:hypothetical protein
MGKMATLVVDKVTKRYVGLLQELLDIVLKTEESLKRLHKNKGGGGTTLLSSYICAPILRVLT